MSLPVATNSGPKNSEFMKNWMIVLLLSDAIMPSAITMTTGPISITTMYSVNRRAKLRRLATYHT